MKSIFVIVILMSQLSWAEEGQGGNDFPMFNHSSSIVNDSAQVHMPAPQWALDLIEEIENKGVMVKNRRDLLRYLYGDTPEANGFRENSPWKKGVPADSVEKFLSVIEAQKGKGVQVNLFQNAHFHADGRKSSRSPSSISESLYSTDQDLDRLQFNTKLYFSKISAKDTNTGGKANLSSKENLGVGASYARSINEDIAFQFRLGGDFVAFNTPSGATLDGESNVYFHGAGGLKWRLDPFWSLSGEMGLRQLPYLTSFGSQLSVDSVTHPFFAGGLQFHMMPWLKKDVRTGFVTEIINNGIGGDTNGSSGVRLGLDLSYHFNIRRLPTTLTLIYNNYSQGTNSTDQSMSELGLWFGFQLAM
ncbi:MAG: hypothetical protein KDD33_05495 [Bdellovibrionales bacterium]|nr:hypothetical protein [Bdellovibrionales bacterium]